MQISGVKREEIKKIQETEGVIFNRKTTQTLMKVLTKRTLGESDRR